MNRLEAELRALGKARRGMDLPVHTVRQVRKRAAMHLVGAGVEWRRVPIMGWRPLRAALVLGLVGVVLVAPLGPRSGPGEAAVLERELSEAQAEIRGDLARMSRRLHARGASEWSRRAERLQLDMVLAVASLEAEMASLVEDGSDERHPAGGVPEAHRRERDYDYEWQTAMDHYLAAAVRTGRRS